MLLTATSAGTSASYAYDPMGRRQSKTVSGTTTLFVDDGDTEVGEYDGTSETCCAAMCQARPSTISSS